LPIGGAGTYEILRPAERRIDGGIETPEPHAASHGAS